jgi:hypothetical protein
VQRNGEGVVLYRLEPSKTHKLENIIDKINVKRNVGIRRWTEAITSAGVSLLLA